ncbi:MAG: response regulator [Patescibacteria group bacterium]
MKKILVVDDRLTRKSKDGESLFLEGKKMGVVVDFVKLPGEVINKDFLGQYSLILMDGQFIGSRLQGPGVVKKIKKISNVPVVMISGSSDLNKEGKKKGADAAISKVDLDLQSSVITQFLFPELKNLIVCLPAEVRGQLMNTFVDIDIDLQAMSELHKKGRGDKLHEFMCSLYQEDKDYHGRLASMRKILSQYKGLEKVMHNGVSLHCLYSSGVLDRFFNLLTNKEYDPEVIMGFKWGMSGINCFNDWYMYFDACLRGGELHG